VSPSFNVRDIIAMMSWRSGLILVALLIWAVTGPIGMAFDGCALACDEPCALTTASISGAPSVPFIVSVAGAAPETLRGRPIRITSSLEPPPRASVLSA
jgi:hypothetical protein